MLATETTVAVHTDSYDALKEPHITGSKNLRSRAQGSNFIGPEYTALLDRIVRAAEQTQSHGSQYPITLSSSKDQLR